MNNKLKEVNNLKNQNSKSPPFCTRNNFTEQNINSNSEINILKKDNTDLKRGLESVILKLNQLKENNNETLRCNFYLETVNLSLKTENEQLKNESQNSNTKVYQSKQPQVLKTENENIDSNNI